MFRYIFDGNGRNESILHIQSKIKDISLSAFILCNKIVDGFEDLSEEEYWAFIQLRHYKNMISQKSEKGNVVVILDQHIYGKVAVRY